LTVQLAALAGRTALARTVKPSRKEAMVFMLVLLKEVANTRVGERPRT
jgi:hypothetical protein